jgi:hypothetical protein
LLGPLDNQFHRRAVRLDKRTELRNGLGRTWEIIDVGLDCFPRSPEKCEGVLIVGKAESTERRDIEGVADVRQAVQTVQPPDGKSRGGDRKADRRHEHDVQQLAEPLAQQLKQLRRRTTHRRGCGCGSLVLG